MSKKYSYEDDEEQHKKPADIEDDSDSDDESEQQEEQQPQDSEEEGFENSIPDYLPKDFYTLAALVLVAILLLVAIAYSMGVEFPSILDLGSEEVAEGLVESATG
tara:strand:- start:1094 stop:1408 length:315 start_codon:yes stop_codon:yes gene_type:complete